MHRFPDISKFQFLFGNELLQICLGQWQIQLNFDKGRISIDSDLEHIDKNGTIRRHNTEEDRLSPLFIHRLLGQSVQTIESEPFCLVIGFDNGDTIRIFTDEGPYECGQIYDDSGLLIVF
jgi:hypothetical protein